MKKAMNYSRLVTWDWANDCVLRKLIWFLMFQYFLIVYVIYVTFDIELKSNLTNLANMVNSVTLTVKFCSFSLSKFFHNVTSREKSVIGHGDNIKHGA